MPDIKAKNKLTPRQSFLQLSVVRRLSKYNNKLPRNSVPVIDEHENNFTKDFFLK